MILLIHNKANSLKRVLYNGAQLEHDCKTLVKAFWKFAEQYPEELIGWCEQDLQKDLSINNWNKIFHHDFIMASYALKTTFLPETIGYIDQLPFVNVNRNVNYATWQMSADVGGIKAKTLMKFYKTLGDITDFKLLLNSIAKLGQQIGLFCYSAPGLVKIGGTIPASTASTTQLFTFVYSHYKSLRLLLLFWCFLRYEKRFPMLALVSALFHKKHFRKENNFSGIEIHSSKKTSTGIDMDVIIPTMGRRKYLLQVMEDLKNQTLLPRKVIIVEQNPDPESQTDLPELCAWVWPFEIVHHFIHQTGACNARNLALDEIKSDWVFFADDDNRIEHDTLEKALYEIQKWGVDLLTLNYRQEGEKLYFDRVKQWGTFGAGNSIVTSRFASKIRFDQAFEHGYGEDKDYGMQLRNAGCDIIYHPGIEILHLKAPRGGFRDVPTPLWEKDLPKPSPTLMVYVKKYYTPEQVKGFKTELFLRYYMKQPIRNPFVYIRQMRRNWIKSEEWATYLIESSKHKAV